MNNYKLNVKQEVYDDIEDIKQFIVSVGNRDLAIQYTESLLAENQETVLSCG